MNSNSPFSGHQTSVGSSSNTQNQSGFMFGNTTTAPMFGQTTTAQSSLMFGQSASGQSVPAFGHVSTGQSAPAFGQSLTGPSSPFGHTTATQSASTFGQSSTSQSSPIFGQVTGSKPAPIFGQGSSSSPLFGQATSSQSASPFGQATTSQAASPFGQTTTSQAASLFGQTTTNQAASLFGQATTNQAASPFGQATSGQAASPFGQATSSQSASLFGQATTSQTASPFGQATTSQATSPFGQATTSQAATPFGQATTSQAASPFGQATTSQPASPFGQATTSQAASPFGQATTSQAASPFGQATTSQAASPFGQATTSQAASPFGQAITSQAASPFGQATTSQAASPFGQATTSQPASLFGQAATSQSSSLFGQSSSSQTAVSFGQTNTTQSTPIFGKTGSAFGQASTDTPSLASSRQSSLSNQTVQGPLFGQTTSGQALGFEKLPSAQAPMFGQVTAGQSFGIGQGTPANFGQHAVSQSSGFGQTVSAQNTVFNQAPGHTTMFGKSTTGQDSRSEFGQATAGQPPSYAQATSMQASIFGASDTGQTGKLMPFNQASGGSEQRSVFGTSSGISGKVPLFGQTSAKSVFGQQPTSFSGQSARETLPLGAHTQMNTESNAADSKLPTSLSSSTFTQVANVPAANSENRFKPPANSTFKPIFGAAPENPQGPGNTSSFTSLNPAKSELHQASYGSIPGAGQSNETNSGSSFSFTSYDQKNKNEAGTSRSIVKNISGNFSSFVSPNNNPGKSHLSENILKDESLKIGKKKEESGRSLKKPDTPSSDDSSLFPRTDHPPTKRPNRHGHQLAGGANLLVRSLYDVVKSHIKTSSKSPKKEETIAGQVTEPDSEPNQTVHTKAHLAPGSSQQTSSKAQPTTGLTQPSASKSFDSFGPNQSGPSRNFSQPGPSYQGPFRSYSAPAINKAVPGRPPPLLEDEAVSADISDTSPKTPLRRARRADSTDNMGPLSPNELTAIQVKNLPKRLNQKQYLEKYFSKFGKVQRLYCRPANKLAIVHFLNHTSAAYAKKMGKKLHKDVAIYWQRKKTSPNKNESMSSDKADMPEESEERSNETEVSTQASPVCRPLMAVNRGPKGSPHKKSLTKSIQFNTESSDSRGPSSDITVITQPPSLSHLVGIVAENSEERYRLLDQRDKILRQTRVKRTDLDQAKTFVGTCPDMCPEKERYMRDTRNQISIFEFLPGTDKLDHAAAIKEYSRSSADQEEPLPHELRPTNVLNQTMDYLVTQIMDHGEENYREWYDFVWNRTRGIRKDITQQHLCDLVTVSLMEKCMRFHIHCAHQLCEEPMSSFDAKINNENLTKCLQSLKEMYQDLRNRGLSCPCEPEFRGYSVLLNLNKGDILREVQQFDPLIRDSAEVKFALQVFSALNSTNFVRFFKLIRSASYLNSCILHRYFNQIRRDALQVLNVAYTASIQRSTSFPLENMVRLLFFHDVNEAAEFLSSYGLSVFDGIVELNRAAFTEPETQPNPKKCLLISHKLQVSIGEIVNGAPLPAISLHQPVCSFDAQNKYTGGMSVADPGTRTTQDILGKRVLAPESKPEGRGSEPEEPIINQNVFTPPPQEPSSVPLQTVFKPIFPPELPRSPPKPLYSDQDIAAVLEHLIEETVREQNVDLSRAAVDYIRWAMRESSLLTESLLTNVTSQFIQTIARDVVQTEIALVQEEKRRKAEEARLKQEREELLAYISQTQCINLLTEVLNENIHDVANKELLQAVQVDHSARIARCAHDVCEQTVSQFLSEEIFQVTRESLREMQCYSKYIQRWRKVLASRKKMRRQMRGFPAAPGSVTRVDKLKALIPSATVAADEQNLANGLLDLGHAGKLSVSITRLMQLRKQNFYKMRVQHFHHQLLCDAAWSPLDLPPLIIQNLPSWKESIFWKVVLILPESAGHSDPSCVLSEWLKAKFYRVDGQSLNNQEQRLQTLSLYSSLETHGGNAVRVNVCVKAAHGALTASELDQAETQKQLLGTSGLLLLLPTWSDENEDGDVYWISALLQLKQLLQAKPFHPPPPLAVLTPGQSQNSVDEVEKELHLSELVSCGLISEYIVIPIPYSVNDLQCTKMVSTAVQFLLSHCPRPLELCSLPLRQYIEDGLCNTFSKRFYHDVWERRKARLPPQDPSAIIDLYNKALTFLAKAISSEHLCDSSWPVSEFTCPKSSALLPHLGWNNPAHLSWLKQVVLSFQIPQIDKPPQGAPWLPVCSMILQYASQICRCPKALPVLVSEVQLLLGRAYKCWRETDEETDGMGSPVQDIPWDDLISLCINHRLRDWDSSVRLELSDSQEEMFVYFLAEDLNNFSPPDTWEKARLNTHKITQHTDNSSLGRWLSSPQTPRTVRSLNFTSEENTEDRTPNQDVYCVKPLTQLKYSMVTEKEGNQKFEEKLQQLLGEEPLDESAFLCLPLYLPEALLKHSDIQQNLKDGSICIPSAFQPLPVKRTAHTHSLSQSLRDCTVRTLSMSESEMNGNVGATSLRATLTDQMDQLQRLLSASQHEDRAYDLHLNTLLDVGKSCEWAQHLLISNLLGLLPLTMIG
ncbi:germinal-center associated nuclear protein [Pelodytes ibericus]